MANVDHECANIYTHEPPDPEVLTDGAMTATSNVLTCAGGGFVVGDIGERIVVHGAGTSGAVLTSTISGFTSATEVTLAHNAVTTVSNAKVRFRLQKLTRDNSHITPTALTNSTLKAPDHTLYATDINDPDWERPNGWVRLGSANTIDLFLGQYDDIVGTAFRPATYAIQAGRNMFFSCKLARTHAGVKPKGHLYVGLWNNDDRALEWLSGGGLTVTATQIGTPAATETIQYIVIARTDRGFEYVSEIESITGPSETSFVPNSVEVLLRWTPRIIGSIKYEIYRKIGAGNVFLLAEVPNSGTSYTDNNPVTKIDTGSASFPASDPDATVKCFMATPLNALDELVADGERNWDDIRLTLPMPASIDVTNATELVLRAGLSEPPSTETIDGATYSTTTVTSANGYFDAAKHVGKAIEITDPENAAHTFTGTVTAVTDANTLTVNTAVGWTGTGNIVEIFEGEPNGLYFDLFGLSFNRGQWSPHTADNAPQRGTPVSRPNASTQGDIILDDDPGGGGIRCFAWYWQATLFDTRQKLLANDLQPKMRIFNGTEIPSVIRKVRKSIVFEAYVLTTETGARLLPVTQTHRYIQNFENLRSGTAVSSYRPGKNTVLRFEDKSFTLNTVKSIEKVDFPEGLLVVSVELEETEDLWSRTFLLANQDGEEFLNHNAKNADDPILVV